MTSDLAAARLALEQGQLDRAEALLQEWLRQHPNNADALERLAIVRARSGDPQGAEVLLHQALQSDPRHRQALTNLGALLQRLGRSSEAGPWLEQATTLHPDHADAWANLAVVHREGGDLTGADLQPSLFRVRLLSRAEAPAPLKPSSWLRGPYFNRVAT